MAIFPDIDPNITSGTQLATLLNSFKDSFAALNKANARDAELVAGGLWVDDTNDPIWDLKMYDGADDITIMSINTTTNGLTFANASESLSIEKITDDSLAAVLELFKRRASGSGQTLDGDTLGQVDFTGYTDLAVKEVQARIEVISTDDVVAGAHGSYLSIQTTSDGTSSLVERIRVSDTGLIGLGTTSPDAKLHVSGTSTTGGIKNELVEDSAIGAKTVKKKSRIAGSGQVLSGDNIATDQYDSTDEVGGDVNVANIKVTATENTSTTASGTKVTLEATRDGDTSPTEEIEVNNGTTTFKSTTASTDKDTGAVVIEGGLGVEGNLNVGGDLTIDGTTTTINSTTLDVTDANITINKNGNEATADDTAGLTVEMSDATDAKIIFDKDATTKFRLGESGSEVAIVDESTAQDVSNKAIKTPSQLDAKQDTYANLVTYAGSTTNGQFCFATDQKVMYQVVDNALTPVGSGGGGLDIWFREDFEVTTSSDWSTGNNATFLGGGTLDGALTDETVTPIAGGRTLVYTAGASSQNDYIASPVIDLDDKQKMQDSGVTFYFQSELESEVVVYDVDNATVLTSVLDVIEIADQPTRYSTTFYPPSTCTQVRFGFHITTAPTNGDILEFDDIEFSLNPFQYKDLIETQAYRIEQLGNALTNTSVMIQYNLGTATISDSGSSLIKAVDNIGSSETRFTALKKCTISVTLSASVTNTGEFLVFRKNGIDYQLGQEARSINARCEVSAEIELEEGEYFTCGANSTAISANTASVILTFVATSTTSHVVTPAKSNMTDWESYTPTFTGFGTVANNSAYYRRVGDTLEVQAFFTAGTTAATVARVSIPSNLTIDTAKVNDDRKQTAGRFQVTTSSAQDISGATNNNGILHIDTITSNTELFWASDANTNASGVTYNRDNANGFCNSSGNVSIVFSVPIAEWSSDVSFLAAVPVQKVAFLKDVKSGGTAGGTFTSGAWQTRDLNTIEGEGSILSLTANQFTLSAGEYRIKSTAPQWACGYHKARLRDIDNSLDIIIGTSEYSQTSGSNAIVTKSSINGRFIIKETTTFEIQHRCTTTTATEGFGRATNIGVDEIYTQVEIVKLR